MNKTHYQARCSSMSRVAGPLVTTINDEFVPGTRPPIAMLPAGSLSALSQLRRIGVAAVVLQQGSFADHFAVMLHSMGVQLAIVPGMGMGVRNARYCAIDGITETITFSDREEGADASEETPYEGTMHASELKVHVDGTNATDIREGLNAGAAGVGLIRSDWLEWESPSPPDASVHKKFILECIKAANPFPVNMRLLDIGGDKIPTWAQGTEGLVSSPVGYRGIRGRHIPIIRDALEQQLQAIADVAASGSPMGIVVPMVSGIADIQWVTERLKYIGGSGVLNTVEMGIMVETPAAALELESLVVEVKHVLIGAGDLTQFTLAKQRSQLDAHEYSGSALHPAVLRLIAMVTATCYSRGVSANLCLSVEPRQNLLRQLTNVNIKTISVSAYSVRRIRACCGSDKTKQV